MYTMYIWYTVTVTTQCLTAVAHCIVRTSQHLGQLEGMKPEINNNITVIRLYSICATLTHSIVMQSPYTTHYSHSSTAEQVV